MKQLERSPMTVKGLENVGKGVTGKSILEYATCWAARTVDYALRDEVLAREATPIHNDKYRLSNPDPGAMTRIVKETALWFGADLVGIAPVNPSWLRTELEADGNPMLSKPTQPSNLLETPADIVGIVMIHEMDYGLLRRTPFVEPETSFTYSRMAWCASSVATFIAELGYRAIPAGNHLALSIPLAVDAGLGQLGRNGLLITRQFGPRVQISKVFTDLPLVADSPVDIGVQRFCKECELCAEHCPSGSIVSGTLVGEPRWPIRATDCLEWWHKNGTDCSICIRVCPWNKPNTVFHRAVRLLAERGIVTRALVFMDQLLGYGGRVKGKSALTDPAVTELPQEAGQADEERESPG